MYYTRILILKISSSVLFLMLIFTSVKGQQKVSKPPNIIIFMIDDMGWQDTSVPFGDSVTSFNRLYHTPNMERLAREGIKLTNAYANSVCTPTRVALMTGMNAAQSRITSWTTIQKGQTSDVIDSTFLPIDWNFDGLSTDKKVSGTAYATPLPQLLKQERYYTIHIGKAHWGSTGTSGSNPHNLGFVVNKGGHAAGHPQSYLGEENFGKLEGRTSPHSVPDLEEYHGTPVFLTEALTREAIKSLNEPVSKNQPFFLHMAHYAVHAPLTADERFYRKYSNMGISKSEAEYASMIEGMDKSLGDIMDYLEYHNLEKNTIIIFMSDNGGLTFVPPRGGNAYIHNLPLRAGKGSIYEGGIRVPMLVKWPGVVKPGSKSEQYLIIEDFFPSILEMAEIKSYSTLQEIAGKSFVPVLRNPAYNDTTRAIVWHFPNKFIMQPGPAISYVSAIRQGDWKLVYLMKEQKLELFNLKNDLGELYDLSEQYRQKTKHLAQVLTKKLKKWNAQMPTYRETNKKVLWPDKLIN
ncbi:sulfatase [Agriterribacter sp.]|uniref:sulfatase n=1 Tax=Agriterribacter sp. TaxID=2821509 RepID=UPI002CF94C28|nr:sulfatase [Agriterribacter sp.]HRO45747.1 sulfatase [Agriterribacter sp.]HRQ15775.1 sulfatase [Agriterribacter sp.]